MSKAQGKFDFSVHHPFNTAYSFELTTYKVFIFTVNLKSTKNQSKDFFNTCFQTHLL